MFNPHSIYAKNKKDKNCIVYCDVNGNLIKLTPVDFSSQQEFEKWKRWSNRDYHKAELLEHRESDHCVSIDVNIVDQAATMSPEENIAQQIEKKKKEARQKRADLIQLIRSKITEKQFERIWKNSVDGLTEVEIAEQEGISQQAVSKSIHKAKEKIKEKIFKE